MCCIRGDRSKQVGTTGSTAPWIRPMIEPKLGRPSRWAWALGKPVTLCELECSSRRPTIERITATLSISPAIRGRCSQMWTPGSLVAMGLYSPRMPSGASGLRSNVSWCGGPPVR